MDVRARAGALARQCGYVVVVATDAVGLLGVALGLVCALILLAEAESPMRLADGVSSVGAVGTGVALLRLNGFLRERDGRSRHRAGVRSPGDRVALGIVTGAGRLLPASARERYVEEWRGLTRDALLDPDASGRRAVAEAAQCLRAAVVLAVVLRTVRRIPR
ncbi:hypothetical protein O7606_23070 [Micromonospora sp. WMMD882]|uniref:hypothetical protein n=1 Tax=Micromonospora sp. WMMD882 TaxID=3015151 RepID=UPI00248C9EB9|nr:hypothetical protein [Micromonospora sp. WMMD882]WBB79038.1 hypothetical protein O7606_23070 [Micromonospora sp. WMMD882]